MDFGAVRHPILYDTQWNFLDPSRDDEMSIKKFRPVYFLEWLAPINSKYSGDSFQIFYYVVQLLQLIKKNLN